MRTLSKRSIKYYLYNKLFTSAVNITGCSKYLINKLKNIYPDIDSERCMHLYNGVSEVFLTKKLKWHQKGRLIYIWRHFLSIEGVINLALQ